MDAIPVTLIVKAPNQQFEDQTIKCEVTWSIKKLKGYLSEVYPCKPSLEEQKLIYSGQLLSDAIILKDVLRQYEGQETHTVHLVYTPKNKNYYNQKQPISKASVLKKDTKPMTTVTQPSQQTNQQQQSRQQPQQQTSQTQSTTMNAESNDGLRHRNTPSTNSNNVQQNLNIPQQFMIPGMMPPFLPMQPMANPAQANQQYSPEQYAMLQQMALQNMMHQMYLQYLNHVSNVMGASAVSMPYFPQSVGGQAPYNAAQATPTQYQNIFETGQQAQPQTQQSQQQQQPQQQPVVPPQQAQPLNDDENENRDWLEIFYTFSRLVVLLSLVYFYSSPIRCSIVIFVMILYYFYHTYQRNLRERQAAVVEENTGAQANRDENESNAEDETVEERETSEADENVPQPESAPTAEEAGENTTTDSTPSDSEERSLLSSTTTESDDNNRLPMITLIRTFVLSFFASLIPETPAV